MEEELQPQQKQTPQQKQKPQPTPQPAFQKIGKMPKGPIGFSEVASVRLGPKGPVPTFAGQSLWGAQLWTSPSRATGGKSSNKKEQLSVYLARHDRSNWPHADTLVVCKGDAPLQVQGTVGEVDFAFSLAQLTAVDVHNGTCKLEFLRDGRGRPVRGGPLVVLTFHERGVLTVGQWKFIEALSARLEKYGQRTEGDTDKSGVRLGLQGEVEWLPQRYTPRGRWVQRMLLLAFALVAAVSPATKMYKWVMSSPLDAFADALQAGALALCFDVAHWVYSGVVILRKLLGGVNQLMARGKAVITEEEGDASPLSPLSPPVAAGGAKKQR